MNDVSNVTLAQQRQPGGWLRGHAPHPLINLWRVLWRRRGTVLGVTALLTCVGVLVVLQLTPRYTATTSIMLGRPQSNVLDIEGVLSGLPGDLETVRTEVEVLRSRDLASKVIDRLALYEQPEFNPTLRAPQFTDTLFDLDRYVPDALREHFPVREPSLTPPGESEEIERIRVLDAFQDRLGVAAQRRSRVITVAFESESARTTERVANAVADVYLVQQLEAKYEATRRATEWLSDRLQSLKENVIRAEREVESYRKGAGLVRSEGPSVTSQQLSEVNTELVLARSRRAEANARLRQVEKLVREGGGAESAAEVLDSPLIQRLREQEATVNRKVAELSIEYGDKHPRMIKARAEQRDIRAKIETEVRKIVQNLRNEVAVARARESSLSSSMGTLQGQLSGMNEGEVKLRALEREANAERVLYETFLARFKETGAQEDLQQESDARIISRALLPTRPSFPHKQVFIALSFLAALVSGALLALLLEQLDQGFRSMEQLEEAIGLRALGFIPLFRKLGTTPEMVVVERPLSAYAEALRSLHTALVLGGEGSGNSAVKSILVTSAVPKEGKSTTAVALARVLARAGHKVVVVDSDLRQPSVHVKLGLAPKPGLVELLTGQASPDEALQLDEASGAYAIAAGRATDAAAELLGRESMSVLVDKLAERFDLVILDSPPVLAVADARVLASLADRCVLVVRWASTRREVVGMAAKLLGDAGVHVAGAALSMVNVRRHAEYGYADSGYYYGDTRKYYTG